MGQQLITMIEGTKDGVAFLAVTCATAYLAAVVIFGAVVTFRSVL